MSMISGGSERDRKGSARLRGARSNRPSAGPRMALRAGGTQDSGAMADEPTELINSLRSRGRAQSPMLDLPPRPGTRRLPRQDESPEAQNFARILFGPGALQARGGSGYQGLDTETMKEAARAMALRSRMQMLEEPRVRDMPNMTLEEMQPYNRPAPDINDAFFGPDRKRFDIVEFLMNLRGR